MELKYKKDDEALKFALKHINSDIKCVESDVTQLIFEGTLFENDLMHEEIIKIAKSKATVKTLKRTLYKVAKEEFNDDFMDAIVFYNLLKDTIEKGVLKHKEYIESNSHKYEKLIVADFYFLEICAGKITEIGEVDGMDKLYKETVNFGSYSRNICSGLKAFYKAEELNGKVALFLTNISEAKFKDEKSHGMICCGSENGLVEAIFMGDDSVGKRIHLDGFEQFFNHVERSNVNFKKSKYAAVLKDFKIVDHFLFFKNCKVLLNGKCISLRKVKNGFMS